MPSTCPQLKSFLSRVEFSEIEPGLRAEIETHLESCRICRADLNCYLKIGHILQRTVYSSPNEDKYLAFLSHVVDRRLHWGVTTPRRGEEFDRRKMMLLLLKVFIGFLVAAGVGASLAMILANTGLFSRKAAPVAADSLCQATERADSTGLSAPAANTDSAPPATVSEQAPPAFPVPDSLSPSAVSETLNRVEPATGTQPLDPGDSTRLYVMQAELGALRDAVSRSPRDNELIQRSIAKSREVLQERRRLGLAERVSDYYNLGYAHYLGHEYRQAILATTDGLQKVKIGPTEYLHYLKAMSHYQLAGRLLTPLPADISANEQARLSGAVLRTQLDVEARRKAVNELRNAIGEFSSMLNRPELAPIARNWILELNQQISAVSAL